LTNIPPNIQKVGQSFLNAEPQPLLYGQDSVRFPAMAFSNPFLSAHEAERPQARPNKRPISSSPDWARKVAGTIPASSEKPRKIFCQVPQTNNIRHPHLSSPSRFPCPGLSLCPNPHAVRGLAEGGHQQGFARCFALGAPRTPAGLRRRNPMCRIS